LLTFRQPQVVAFLLVAVSAYYGFAWELNHFCPGQGILPNLTFSKNFGQIRQLLFFSI